MRVRKGREGKRGVREGERGEGGKEEERGRGRVQKHKCIHTHINKQTCTHTHTVLLRPYHYVLYTHPERDQCYNESRQRVPDASSGPGQ